MAYIRDVVAATSVPDAPRSKILICLGTYSRSQCVSLTFNTVLGMLYTENESVPLCHLMSLLRIAEVLDPRKETHHVKRVRPQSCTLSSLSI